MRKKILAFVFATALALALAVPLFGAGTAAANHPPGPPGKCTIEHNGKEMTLPHHAAEKHLLKHAGDVNKDCEDTGGSER